MNILKISTAFIAALLFGFSNFSQASEIKKTKKQYNVVLIMADDVGAEAFGSYGGTAFKTLEIDTLAKEGMRFENAHSQPLCTPSRVKIMTGQHNFRNYEHFAHMNPSLTTFGTLMQKAGYATKITGKWQLYRHKNDDQNLKGMTPELAGFDEYFLWQLFPDVKSSRYWKPMFNDNGRRIFYGKDDFGPKLINDKALEFIERKKDEPFFLYYPMVLPHSPFVNTPDASGFSRQAKYSAMLRYMDKMVGNVRQKILDLNIDDHTIIIFTGDNGSNDAIYSIQNGKKVRGAKGQTIGHGTHVPFIVWGGPAIASSHSDSLVDFSDILPTLLELAGITPSKNLVTDGESIVSIVKGQTSNANPADEYIFIHYEPKNIKKSLAIRYIFNKRWKLYDDGRFFNIEKDPMETNPIYDKQLTNSELSVKDEMQAIINSKV